MARARTLRTGGTLLLVALTTARAVDAQSTDRDVRADAGLLVVTADHARKLHDRLQALRADDGCNLESLRTERDRVSAVWQGPGQERVQARLTPVAPTGVATPELRFRLETARAARETCPTTLRAAEALLQTESFGPLARASDPVPSSLPKSAKARAPRDWRAMLGDLDEDLTAPSPPRLALHATLLRAGWGVALGLSVLALVATRRALRRHWCELLGVALVALCFRVLLADFHLADERLPYLTQATCIAFPQARGAYNLCSLDLFGDVHQLGVASLFSWGFSLVGGLAEVAGAMILALGVANALLVYALGRRVFGSGPAPLLAGLLYAVHPWAIHFAGATQTEVPNDSFLLLGSLLLVWDTQRRAAVPRALAARVAASPLFRGFFVAMAAATRPEQLAWLPLMAAVWLWVERPWWRAASRVALLGACSGLLLIPTLGALLTKSSRLNPLGEVPTRLWEHLVDAHHFLLGTPAALALLASLTAMVYGVRPAERQRTLALLTVSWFLAGWLAAGWLAQALPRQDHIAYHGSVLWWPVLAAGLTRAASRLAKGAPERQWWRGATPLHLVGMGLLMVSFNACASTRVRGLSLLGLQAERHRKLVRALPERVQVLSAAQVYVGAPVAAALFDRGGDVAFSDTAALDPARRFRPDCNDLRQILAVSRAQGRLVVLIHDPRQPDFRPEPLAPTDLVRSCGLVVGELQPVEGFRLFSVDVRPGGGG